MTDDRDAAGTSSPITDVLKALELERSAELQDVLASLLLSECVYKAVDKGPTAAIHALTLLRDQFPSRMVHLDAAQYCRRQVAHKYMLATGGGALYAAFMGSKELRDLLTDVTAVQRSLQWASAGIEEPLENNSSSTTAAAASAAAAVQAVVESPAVHGGFLNRADGVPVESLYHLARQKNLRLVLCGHSLGGAVAMLATLRLLSSFQGAPPGPECLLCIGFGVPALGNAALVDLVIERKWSRYFKSFALPEDPVPRLFVKPAHSTTNATPIASRHTTALESSRIPTTKASSGTQSTVAECMGDNEPLKIGGEDGEVVSGRELAEDPALEQLISQKASFAVVSPELLRPHEQEAETLQKDQASRSQDGGVALQTNPLRPSKEEAIPIGWRQHGSPGAPIRPSSPQRQQQQAWAGSSLFKAVARTAGSVNIPTLISIPAFSHLGRPLYLPAFDPPEASAAAPGQPLQQPQPQPPQLVPGWLGPHRMASYRSRLLHMCEAAAVSHSEPQNMPTGNRLRAAAKVSTHSSGENQDLPRQTPDPDVAVSAHLAPLLRIHSATAELPVLWAPPEHGTPAVGTTIKSARFLPDGMPWSSTGDAEQRGASKRTGIDTTSLSSATIPQACVLRVEVKGSGLDACTAAKLRFALYETPTAKSAPEGQTFRNSVPAVSQSTTIRGNIVENSAKQRLLLSLTHGVEAPRRLQGGNEAHGPISSPSLPSSSSSSSSSSSKEDLPRHRKLMHVVRHAFAPSDQDREQHEQHERQQEKKKEKEPAHSCPDMVIEFMVPSQLLLSLHLNLHPSSSFVAEDGNTDVDVLGPAPTLLMYSDFAKTTASIRMKPRYAWIFPVDPKIPGDFIHRDIFQGLRNVAEEDVAAAAAATRASLTARRRLPRRLLERVAKRDAVDDVGTIADDDDEGGAAPSLPSGLDRTMPSPLDATPIADSLGRASGLFRDGFRRFMPSFGIIKEKQNDTSIDLRHSAGEGNADGKHREARLQTSNRRQSTKRGDGKGDDDGSLQRLWPASDAIYLRGIVIANASAAFDLVGDDVAQRLALMADLLTWKAQAVQRGGALVASPSSVMNGDTWDEWFGSSLDTDDAAMTDRELSLAARIRKKVHHAGRGIQRRAALLRRWRAFRAAPIPRVVLIMLSSDTIQPHVETPSPRQHTQPTSTSKVELKTTMNNETDKPDDDGESDDDTNNRIEISSAHFIPFDSNIVNGVQAVVAAASACRALPVVAISGSAARDRSWRRRLSFACGLHGRPGAVVPLTAPMVERVREQTRAEGPGSANARVLTSALLAHAALTRQQQQHRVGGDGDGEGWTLWKGGLGVFRARL